MSIEAEAKWLCPFCQVEMRQIQVLEHYEEQAIKGLRYVVKGAEHHFLHGYHIEGTLQAGMCPRCNRVEWYAEPGNVG